MPIAVDPNWTADTYKASTTGTSLTYAAHDVSGTNRVMMVTGQFDQFADGGITFNSDALTVLSTSTGTTYAKHMWRLVAPDLGANNVVITVPLSEFLGSAEISFTGAHQTQTTAAETNTQTTATSITQDLTTTADGSMVLSYLVKGNAATPTEGQGTFASYQSVNPNNHATHYIIKAIAGAQTMSWSWAGSTTADEGIYEILAAAATVSNHWLLTGV
mgnify:CR=1 FL=1